jgi:hypothetical protein
MAARSCGTQRSAPERLSRSDRQPQSLPLAYHDPAPRPPRPTPQPPRQPLWRLIVGKSGDDPLKGASSPDESVLAAAHARPRAGSRAPGLSPCRPSFTCGNRAQSVHPGRECPFVAARAAMPGLLLDLTGGPEQEPGCRLSRRTTWLLVRESSTDDRFSVRGDGGLDGGQLESMSHENVHKRDCRRCLGRRKRGCRPLVFRKHDQR